MSRDVRLYALLARNAPRAVIFRRGPSKRVLVIGWNTSTDRFEQGQWFNGRIYERRCDLSPEGDLLLYFAASYRRPFFSWTAVSRPPFLTALALWPKGDAWGGGGHFVQRSRIALNHFAGQGKLAEGFALPSWMTVGPLGDTSGRGEDDPIWSRRLERDGWIAVSGGKIAKRDYDAKVWIELDPPIVFEKRNPAAPDRTTLQMTIRGIKERNGPWYLTEHALISADAQPQSLGRTEWADWLPTGDLVFSKGPSLYRLDAFRGRLAPLQEAREIANFGDLTFTPREAPPNSRKWPKR